MKHTKTRIAFLGYAEIALNEWRYIHLEAGRNAAVGEIYPSEKDLLADLNRYASTWGKIESADKKLLPGEVLVRTTASVGFDVKWDIIPWLSDCRGRLIIDRNSQEYLTAAKALANDQLLQKRLQNMMRKEVTCIAQKEGEFGILFEVEYLSAESAEAFAAFDDEYPPEIEMFERLSGYAKQLEAKFPGQLFVVPEPAVIIHGRPALWTFVPLDGATAESLDAIAEACLGFAYPVADDA